MTSTYHIVPQENDWAVKKEGNERNSSTHSTQTEAIDGARNIASEGDALIIHRPDGTIREKITNSGNSSNGKSSEKSDTPKLNVEDVMSVGSRVSWGAILAGGVVALTVYIGLSFLAGALTVTTYDEMSTRTLTWTAAIVGIFISLVSLFLGGFVVSRMTVGENKLEAITYGLLLWGALLVFFLFMGSTIGMGFAAALSEVNQNVTLDANQDNELTAADIEKKYKIELNPEDKTAINQAGSVGKASARIWNNASPATKAWSMFGWIVLSIFASVGGSVAGAGPELVLKQMREKRLVIKA